MRNKKKNRILLLLILLLGISIGFAALATTLKINGTANIGKNSWNIYWDNIANKKGVVPENDPEITAYNNVPKTLLTWEVDLDKPGDYFEFEVDAVNAGTLDAEIIGITSKYDDTPVISTNNGVIVEDNTVIPSYIKYSVKYKENGAKPALGDKLSKAPDLTSTPPVYTRKTYVIHVEFDKEAVTPTIVNNMNENGESHTFTFQVTYGQAAAPSAVAFATDPWDVIAEEGNEAAKQESITNNKCGAYNVGDTRIVKMDMNGDNTSEDYTVRITNCSTPAVCSTNGYSQTACGFVVEFVSILSTHKMNSIIDCSTNGNCSKGGWEYSDMRAYLNSGIYPVDNQDYTGIGVIDKLPVDLKPLVATTTVVSGYGGNDSSNFTTLDKLYLLSTHEIWEGGSDNYDTAYSQTRQLDYYSSIGATLSNSPVEAAKTAEWWTRTPYPTYADSFYSSHKEGWPRSWGCTNEHGVSPAFKLK